MWKSTPSIGAVVIDVADCALISLLGQIRSIKPHAGRMLFELRSDGRIYICFDVLGGVDASTLRVGQFVICWGRWSTGIRDYFEFERIEHALPEGSLPEHE